MGRLNRSVISLACTALACSLALVACNRGEARPDLAGDAGPYAKQVAKAIPQIEKTVGLKFKHPPKVERRSKDEVRAFLERRFNEESPTKDIAGMERAYKRFGMLPDTLKLRSFLLELLTEQIVGYYDPAAKTLYIVDGAPDDLAGVTITHELVHALQDQYIDLDSLQHISGDNDRATAAQAVIEGQATYVHMRLMLGGGTLAAQLPGGWDRVREAVRDAQGSMPQFAAAPLLLQETLIFPYLSGMEFMRTFEAKQPNGVPFSSMPVSTEQVMHESAYFGQPRDEPTRVTLPAIPGTVYSNDLGEFETRLFLFQHLQDQAAAVRGAAGWDGDRYVVFDTPNGEGIAWLSVWDSAVDSGEFYDLLDTAILKRYPNARPTSASRTERSYTGAGRTVTITAGEVSGRPVVLYVDVPAGARANVVDLSRVTLQQER